MRATKGWRPGAVQERPTFVHVRADHSEHEQAARAAKLDEIDADIQRRAAEHLEELRDYLTRVRAVMREAKRGTERRAKLAEIVTTTRHEVGALEQLIGTNLPDAEQLPRYIERRSGGYRVAMSRKVYGTVYNERSETYATIPEAVAQIVPVRRRLDRVVRLARKQVERQGRESA